MKKILLLLVCFTYVASYAQKKCENIRCIFVLDDEVSESGSVSGTFVYLPKNTNDSVTINFSYQVGRLVFDSDGDYERISKIEKGQHLIMEMSYRQTDPFFLVSHRQPVTEWWTEDDYMIMNIYNLENKKNRKKFPKKIGTGVELHTGKYATFIERKKK